MDYTGLSDDKQTIEKLKEIIRKDNIILNLYERWMRLKNNNRGVFNFIQENDFSKVAVYGMGSLGRSLCAELTANNINVAYVIEQNLERRNNDYIFYTIKDELPDADVIIITPITSFNEIAQELSEKTKCPLLSLDDIVP